MAKKTGKKSSCESSFKKEMDNQPFFSASANYFVFKTKTWQTTPFANNQLMEQLRIMSFDKVQN